MKIRKVLAVVMAATVIGVFAMQSSAESPISYSASDHKKVGHKYNNYTYDKYLHVNNSYGTGTCAIYLSIENSNGTTSYGRKLFPKGTTVSDLVRTIPGHKTRYFWVEPQINGNTVTGEYVYYLSISS